MPATLPVSKKRLSPLCLNDLIMNQIIRVVARCATKCLASFFASNAMVSHAGAGDQNLCQLPNSKSSEDSRQRRLDGVLGGMLDKYSVDRSVSSERLFAS